MAIKVVFWIRDILVQIRIRGSVTLTNGSGSCYFFFVSDLQDAIYLFFCLFLLEGTGTTFQR
jgi:hypothetical protein